MDYIGLGKIFRYQDYDNFLNKNKKRRIILMTTKAKKHYHKFKFKKDDILLFGRESAGVPNNLHETIKDKIKIPMNKKTRSLNVAMSVAIISAEALRQNNLLK
jgi:tRNA (cytidine/uridine-2'-O-)-methyltransferase